MQQSHQIITEHAVSMVKTAAGGIGVASGTYAAVSSLDIVQATAIAGLAAACMTALYFGVMALYTIWKWAREANGKN